MYGQDNCMHMQQQACTIVIQWSIVWSCWLHCHCWMMTIRSYSLTPSGVLAWNLHHSSAHYWNDKLQGVVGLRRFSRMISVMSGAVREYGVVCACHYCVMCSRLSWQKEHFSIKREPNTSKFGSLIVMFREYLGTMYNKIVTKRITLSSEDNTMTISRKNGSKLLAHYSVNSDGIIVH